MVDEPNASLRESPVRPGQAPENGRVGSEIEPVSVDPQSLAGLANYRQRVLDAMTRFGLSARALGLRAGLAPDTIGKLLKGEAGCPHLRTQLALQRRFSIEPLARDEDPGEPVLVRSKGALLAMPVPDRLRALFAQIFAHNREPLDVATLDVATLDAYRAMREKLARADGTRRMPPVRQTPIDAGLARLSRGASLEDGVVKFSSELGAWRIEMDRGRGADSSLLLAVYAAGSQNKRNGDIFALVCATRAGLRRFLEIVSGNMHRRRRGMPRRGAWKVREDRLGPYYVSERLPKPQEAERYRRLPHYAVVEDDVASFFDDIGSYEDADQVPFRKFCMIGAPGTGKTSIAKALLERYRLKMPVFVVSSFAELHLLLVESERTGRRVLVYGEEIDALLGEASQDQLAVLDGIRTPRTAGCYALFSTNFPEMIDPRLRERPGRIDTLYDVAPMAGEDAVGLFASLTPIETDERVEIAKALDRTTIAELKEIAFRARRKVGRKAIENGARMPAAAVLEARRELVDSLRAGQTASSGGGRRRARPGDGGRSVAVSSYDPSRRADEAISAAGQVENRMSGGAGPAAPVAGAGNPWGRRQPPVEPGTEVLPGAGPK